MLYNCFVNIYDIRLGEKVLAAMQRATNGEEITKFLVPFNIHAVALALKLYVSRREPQLIPHELRIQLIRSMEPSRDPTVQQDVVGTMRAVLQQISHTEREELKALLYLLADVKSTEMSSIAQVWAPVLLLSQLDRAELHRYSAQANAVISILLRNVRLIL